VTQEIIATCKALRVFRHGKPDQIRWAAENTIYLLRSIVRGRVSPELFASLREKIEQMRV
jgi:hypothetical protein